MPANLSTIPPTDLDAVEAELKTAYLAWRRYLSPNYKPRAGTWTAPAWAAAARLVVSLRADPTQFVKGVFLGWEGRRHPQPSDLHTEHAAYLNRMCNRQCGSRGVVSFLGQENRLAAMIRAIGTDIDGFVCDPYLDNTALFRIAHCSDAKLPEMLAQYGDAAINQLSCDRPLLRYFRQRFPARAAILLDGPDEPDATSCDGNEEQLDRSTPPSIACPPLPAVATR